jgi:flagellar hook-associated protein 2
MATFNFSGVVSGLDTQSMITALMNAERMPLTRLQNQRKALDVRKTAYGDLRSLLAKLEAAAKAFTKDQAGAKRAAASSNPSVLTAGATTSADAASYAVAVSHLATGTRATSTAALGTPITDADLGTNLADLNLPGGVTAGTISMVVDGRVVHASIGAPGSTTLGDALAAIGTALTAQVQANEGVGSSAIVSASVVGNRVAVSLAGSTTTHTLTFGVGGDTSNALGVLGLAGTGSTR